MTAIRIGHLSTLYHTAVLLMAPEYNAGRTDLPLDWRLFGTGPAIVKAFERKELDMAYIGLPPSIIGISLGVKIKCVAGGHVEGTVISGRTGSAGYPELSGLKDILSQFSGKKIGVPGNGSIHDVIIRESLNKTGLTGEIDIVNFQWADQIIEALIKGAVSAAAGTPALAVALKNYAGGRILYPPSLLWPNNPSYGILADAAFLMRNSAIIEEFLVLHEKATRLLREQPKKAAKIIADFVGIVDRHFVLDTLVISPRYCANLSPEFISSTLEFAKKLKKLRYISRDVVQEDIFDLSIIRKIHPEKSHY